MSMQDPIADMLIRFCNAVSAGLKKVEMPSSKEKVAIAGVLKETGYIGDFSVSEDGVKKVLAISIKYYNGKPVIEGIERVSKPSRRMHCTSGAIPRVRNGLGTVILSTDKGIMSGDSAANAKVGGEIICYVW